MSVILADQSTRKESSWCLPMLLQSSGVVKVYSLYLCTSGLLILKGPHLQELSLYRYPCTSSTSDNFSSLLTSPPSFSQIFVCLPHSTPYSDTL